MWYLTLIPPGGIRKLTANAMSRQGCISEGKQHFKVKNWTDNPHDEVGHQWSVDTGIYIQFSTVKLTLNWTVRLQNKTGIIKGVKCTETFHHVWHFETTVLSDSLLYTHIIVQLWLLVGYICFIIFIIRSFIIVAVHVVHNHEDWTHSGGLWTGW